MRAGDLRHRVIIEENRPTQNAFGEEAANWQPIRTVWADVRALSAREFIANERAQAEVSHKIKLRYFPGIVPSMRVRWGARIFEIEGVLEDRTQQELLLMAREAVHEGGQA